MQHEFGSELNKQICQLLDQAMEKIENCLVQVNEDQVWWRPQPELNSIGNLLLHMAGNLRQWSTVALLQIEDLRDRDSEFSTQASMSREDIVSLLTKTVEDSKRAILQLPSHEMLARVRIQGFDVTFMEALLHTASHFQGHTQQVILLTRMIKGGDYRFHWSPDQGRDRLPM